MPILRVDKNQTGNLASMVLYNRVFLIPIVFILHWMEECTIIQQHLLRGGEPLIVGGGGSLNTCSSSSSIFTRNVF